MNVVIIFFSILLASAAVGFANNQHLAIAGLLGGLSLVLCVSGLLINGRSKQ